MKYRVLIGMNIPPERRVEPGETLPAKDLDKTQIPMLLELGAIEPVKE